jgi:serine/threonine protein phosphatase PrpC
MKFIPGQGIPELRVVGDTLPAAERFLAERDTFAEGDVRRLGREEEAARHPENFDAYNTAKPQDGVAIGDGVSGEDRPQEFTKSGLASRIAVVSFVDFFADMPFAERTPERVLEAMPEAAAYVDRAVGRVCEGLGATTLAAAIRTTNRKVLGWFVAGDSGIIHARKGQVKYETEQQRLVLPNGVSLLSNSFSGDGRPRDGRRSSSEYQTPPNSPVWDADAYGLLEDVKKGDRLLLFTDGYPGGTRRLPRKLPSERIARVMGARTSLETTVQNLRDLPRIFEEEARAEFMAARANARSFFAEKESQGSPGQRIPLDQQYMYDPGHDDSTFVLAEVG